MIKDMCEYKYLTIWGGYLETFFRRLNECGVRYCVLRNYMSLPQSAGGSDVDMWVHADDVEKALCVSETTKKECGYHLVSKFGDATAVKLCFQNEYDGIQIDMFCGAIYYRNRVLLDGEVIEKHTHVYNGITVMQDDFGDLLAFLKEILNNGKCERKYIEPIAGNSVFSVSYIEEAFPHFPPSFIAELHRIINKGITDDMAIARLADAGRQALSHSTGVSKFGILWHKLLRLFRHPGYVIAVENLREYGETQRLVDLLEGGFHHGVMVCDKQPTAKQVLPTFFKAKVLLVDRKSYHSWLHPKPDIVADASLPIEELMRGIVKKMARRFE